MTEALPSRSDGASISDPARALKLREKRAPSARLLTGYRVAETPNNVETSGSPPTLLELMSSLVTAWRNLAAYPPGHPVRAFARALYRRNGGVLRFEEGVEPRELEAFLALLGDTGPARDRALTVEV